MVTAKDLIETISKMDPKTPIRAKFYLTEKMEVLIMGSPTFKLVFRAYSDESENPGRFAVKVDKLTFDSAVLGQTASVDLTLHPDSV